MTNRHVLIAEDEPHIRFTLSLILRKCGYNVSTTNDSWSALEVIEEMKETPQPVDLLVTDIERVGVNVFNFLDDLEKSDVSLPILVITGYGQEDIMVELKRRNSVISIDKPFAPNDLIKRIDNIFDKTGQKSTTPGDAE